MKPNATEATYSGKLNRLMYGFLLITAIILFVRQDTGWSLANAGLALAFDPFTATVAWQHRPAYQKVWLLVHVLAVLAGFSYLFFFTA